MASLKCSNCGFGIHYNDEPNGIEYTAISENVWNEFSSSDKPICRYILDSNQEYLIIWRCPECECIHLFSSGVSKFKQAYIPSNSSNSVPCDNNKFIVFIDYLYENIAEKGLTASEFENNSDYDKSNLFYMLVSNDECALFSDKKCTNVIMKYIAIETKTEE